MAPPQSFPVSLALLITSFKALSYSSHGTNYVFWQINQDEDFKLQGEHLLDSPGMVFSSG